MSWKRSRIVVGLSLSAAVAGGIVFMRLQPPQIDVVVPLSKNVVTSIAASGRLRGDIETNVGAQTSGRVKRMLVHEGDRIRSGDVIAELDTDVLSAQVSQAEVGVATSNALLLQAMTQLGTAKAQVMSGQDVVRTAKATLQQVSRPPLASEFERLRADVEQAVAVADAKLISANNRLLELRSGATKEERDQAKAQVQQADAQLVQAERDLKRQRALVEDGAVSRSVLDNADTVYKVALRAKDTADAKLAQLLVGTRKEQIAQAEADVRVASVTLIGAKSSGFAQMQTLRAQPRKEDVLVAQRKLAEAERGRILAEYKVGEAEQGVAVAQTRLQDAERSLQVALRRVADTVVRAPFDGIVTSVVTEPGGITGPNQPIVRLVRSQQPEIRIDLDEVNLGKVRTNQIAKVSCDAFPKDVFDAKVTEIGAQVDADRGTVEVRLVPLTSPSWLRPGQTLSVNIVTDTGTQRLVIPLTAVNTIGGQSTVLTIADGRVVATPVTVAAPGPDGVPVLTGLKEGDEVVVIPTGHKAGDPARAHKVSGVKS